MNLRPSCRAGNFAQRPETSHRNSIFQRAIAPRNRRRAERTVGHRQGAHPARDVETPRWTEGLRMISEQYQDQSGLYVLGALSPEEQCAFETELRGKGELRDLVLQLQRATGLMAKSIPQTAPPPQLKAKILERITPAKSVPSPALATAIPRSEEHTSELQSLRH